MLEEIGAALGLSHAALAVTGDDRLPSCFPVTDLAVASIGAAGLAAAELVASDGGTPATVTVDRHLANSWFRWSILPLGWDVPAPWDPIAGDYRAGDGWIRLHTNAPAHRRAALSVLDCAPDRESVATAVKGWEADRLEQAVVDASGCAATMRTTGDWARHAQGRAVTAEPLIALSRTSAAAYPCWRPSPERPLTGVRVLDLTRILAGPIATRFLAGLGADVLRIDPPGWDEPSVAPDVTPGKRCARLDLRKEADRRTFEGLLADADILIHGYRPGALDGLGYGEAARRRIAPGLVDVTLSAYGWSGPWAGRRGFDSLVQMSGGIAAAGMAWQGADRPFPLPVQALDHATGYLMAATSIRGLTERLRDGTAMTARLSLARTAALLAGATAGMDGPEWARGPDDFAPKVEATGWGEARRLRSPVTIGGTSLSWARPAMPLGSAKPVWDTTGPG